VNKVHEIRRCKIIYNFYFDWKIYLLNLLGNTAIICIAGLKSKEQLFDKSLAKIISIIVILTVLPLKSNWQMS